MFTCLQVKVFKMLDPEISNSVDVCGTAVYGTGIWGICADAQLWLFSMVTHLENLSFLEFCRVMQYSWIACRTIWQWCDVQATCCQMVLHVCIWLGQCGAGNDQSGEWSLGMMEVNNIHVKELFQMDRCVILQHMVSHVGFSYGTVWHIVVDVLGMPCVLTVDNKVTRLMACQFPATLHSRGKQLCVSSH